MVTGGADRSWPCANSRAKAKTRSELAIRFFITSRLDRMRVNKTKEIPWLNAGCYWGFANQVLPNRDGVGGGGHP